ncbi:MAG: linear amide C-N hydrolase, partial [Ilumatobacteraceae bacterium]
FSRLLPAPADEREAVASILAVARNVSVPFGSPYKDVGIYDTEYRTVSDLTDRRYFFELTTSPNVIWVELDMFALEAGSSPTALTPGDISLSGDVSGRFTPLAAAPF